MLNGKRDDMPWLAEKERNDMPSPTGGETTCHDQGGGETTCYDSWERQHALKTWHVISPSPVKHDMSSLPLTHGISSPPRYAWDIISPPVRHDMSSLRPPGMVCRIASRYGRHASSRHSAWHIVAAPIGHNMSSRRLLGMACRLSAY